MNIPNWATHIAVHATGKKEPFPCIWSFIEEKYLYCEKLEFYPFECGFNELDKWNFIPVAECMAKNKFITIDLALRSENIPEFKIWLGDSIDRNETVMVEEYDQCGVYRHVSIHRDENGLFERPYHVKVPVLRIKEGLDR